MSEPLIPPHGGYKKLVTYQLGNLIYDATVAFCERYISRKDRTFDQMVQAARSGAGRHSTDVLAKDRQEEGLCV